MTTHRTLLLAVLSVVFLAASAFAGDPPARVARLNYMDGQVSIQPNGVEEWVAASINRPLTSSDRLWTDRASRAELQLGDASVRTNDETSLTLVNVSDNNVQLQLDQGTLNLHVTDLFDGEVYEVDTPNIRFVVRKKGNYRFDVDNAGDTTKLTVFKGEGEVTGDGPSLRVGKDESYTFNEGRSLRYLTSNHNPGRDGFDDWCFARADREDRAESAKYVSRYAVGYSDLDDYGYWETVPTYGPIWYPRVVVTGWAPYRFGHWVWVSPWGWTWVDDSPWGFAPYHYGRWVNYGSRWGWCPGPIHVRPIYAPALVAWVGGSHWGVGLSFGIGGGVGWFPLGWGEPYIPYYGHSRNYFQRVNITNTHITNITYVTNNYYNRRPPREWNYKNRDVSNAVTAVSNDTFRLSRPTRNGIVHVNQQELKTASIERNVGLRPTTNSMLGEHAGDPRRTPPSTWARPTHSTPGTVSAGDADRGRPSRNMPGAPARETVNAPPANAGNVEAGRPSRGVPRPGERGGPVANSEAEHRGGPVTAPNATATESAGSTVVMPSRVPRPNSDASSSYRRPARETPSSLSQPMSSYSHTDATPPVPNVNATRPERSVPRPPEGQVIRQDPRPMDMPQRGGRHTEATPPSQPERSASRSNDNVNIGRPTRSEAPETHSAPARTEVPQVHSAPSPPPQVHSAPSAPPRQAEPQRQESRPDRQQRQEKIERKVEQKNNGGSASLRYPSPRNSGQTVNAYRAASFRESDTPVARSFAATQRTERRSYSPSASSYASRQSFSAGRSSAPRMSTVHASPSRSFHGSAGGGRSASRASGGGSRRRG